MTAPVSLQKCLESVLDRSQARRYIRNAATAGVMPARHYYNTALRDLSSKDSEGAIHNLILALEAEREHEASLHLVKTMLFGLSKKFHESGGETYKQKYSTLANWVASIEKEITENDLPKYEQEKSMDEIFADLNNLVGLENIKQVLKDLVDLIELKIPCVNLCL